MRYLITGGAGFIGSHLTEALTGDGSFVTVIDNFATGRRSNLDHVEPALLNLIEADVVETPEIVAEQVKRCDCVVHLAAAVGVDLVVKDPVHTIITNVRGTENVLTAAAAHRKRTLIASTSEVYGKSAKERFSEADDLLIGTPTRSRWSYACSKLLDEFYLMAYHRASGLPGTVVRFFNTVGPRQTGVYGMVVPRFVAAALQGEPLRVFGDGKQSRCFCHVLDVVAAIRALLDQPASVGNIYNIGSDRSITISELAELVIRQTRSSSRIVKVPYDQAYEKGFEDMRRRRPDTSALRTLTGWEPQRTLEQVIDDVAAEFTSGRSFR